MRKLLLLLAVVMVFVAGARADSTCTNATQVFPNPGFSCSIGGLIFGDFLAVDAGNVPSPTVTLVNFAQIGSNIFLTFNPNLGSSGSLQDIFLFFDVTGGINGIDLSVGGQNATIQELACSQPIPSSPPNTGECPMGLLANLTAFSQSGTVSGSFPGGNFVSPVFIFKDINVAQGGSLTNFTESFVVPEPGTLALLGSGLVGIAGLLRRKLLS